jgi:hypothetical protein
MKHIILTLVLLGFAVDAMAAPVKVPPLKLCMGSGGTLISRKKCKRSELLVDMSVLSASIGGALDVTKCVARSKQSADDGFGWVRAGCQPGEWMLSHGVSAPDNDSFEIQEIRLLANPGESWPSGVEYVIYAPGPWIADVLVFCCPRN